VIRRSFGEKVFTTSITPSVKIEETATIQKTIFQHDRKSTAARDFMELGREVLSRLSLEPVAIVSEEINPQSDSDMSAEVTYGDSNQEE
jgi:urease gamma subunit